MARKNRPKKRTSKKNTRETFEVVWGKFFNFVIIFSWVFLFCLGGCLFYWFIILDNFGSFSNFIISLWNFFVSSPLDFIVATFGIIGIIFIILSALISLMYRFSHGYSKANVVETAFESNSNMPVLFRLIFKMGIYSFLLYLFLVILKAAIIDFCISLGFGV